MPNRSDAKPALKWVKREAVVSKWTFVVYFFYVMAEFNVKSTTYAVNFYKTL